MRQKPFLKSTVLALSLFTASAGFTQTQYPFQDPSRSFEERVNDLVSRAR